MLNLGTFYVFFDHLNTYLAVFSLYLVIMKRIKKMKRNLKKILFKSIKVDKGRGGLVRWLKKRTFVENRKMGIQIQVCLKPRGQTSDKISLNQLKARISHAVRECQIIQFVREYQKLPPYFESYTSENNAR